MAFRLSIVSDEISEDFERALDLAQEWGLRQVDLRTLWGKNVVDLTPEEMERARSALAKRRISVECIASPLFKSPLRVGDADPGGIDFHVNLVGADSQTAVLTRAMAVGRVVGAHSVRAFSFWRRPLAQKDKDDIVAHLRRAAEYAAAEGFMLVLENEHTCTAATGAETGELLDAVNSANLKAIWDPGNARVAGEIAYPDGYLALRGRIANVHVKDCVRVHAPGEEPWRLLGEGEVDWPGQIAALAADGYDGPITLETHPIGGYGREEASYRCLQNLRLILAGIVGVP